MLSHTDTDTHPTTLLDEVYSAHNANLEAVELSEMISHFAPNESISILFDGPNFYGTVSSIQVWPNYGKLFSWFRTLGNVRSIYYFTAVSSDPHHAKLQDQLTWMSSNGVRVRTMASVKDSTGRWTGNMDVDIAVVALTECLNSDHIVLASGDGHFVPLVVALQRMGKKVTILSSRGGDPCVLSKDLRQSADGFIDIQKLASIVTQPRSPVVSKPTVGKVPV